MASCQADVEAHSLSCGRKKRVNDQARRYLQELSRQASPASTSFACSLSLSS